ncbi:MAG: ribosome recycling factor [Bacteroidetes bacterium]|nr:ribosome recycling factor [Bacteroidota bacterium]MBU2584952.1 ribosome recycling factor [Bacteroidota bacterium]
MKNTILTETEDKMQKATEVLRQELVKIRTGKATTALLDGIKVDYYGSMVPLNQTANVSVGDIHTILVQPWDKSAIQAIDKAILASELGLNPISDGDVLRIPIPALNEERRKELVKLIKRFGEEGKIAIRNIRRDGNDQLKKAEKEEHLPEDERKRGEQEVQKLTDKYIKAIDDLLAHKEKEIMEV